MFALSPGLDSELRAALQGATLKDLAGRTGSGRSLCTLLITGLKECRALSSVLDCVRKLGAKRLEVSLHAKCTQSGWWRSITKSIASSVSNHSSFPAASSLAPLPVNYIRESQIVVAHPRRLYVPPHRRTASVIDLNSTKVVIRSGKLGGAFARPINFGIPRELIVGSVSRTKVFSMCPLTAGWLGTRKNYQPIPKWVLQQQQGRKAGAPPKYSLDASEEYTLAQMYIHSYFAFTMFRGGTDCQRHLEILARGAVPYFPDVGLRCSSTCLAAYPLQLLREVLDLPGIAHWKRNHYENEYFARGKVFLNLKSRPTINFTAFDHARYFALADKLLQFTRRHLTCGATMAYVLRAAGHEEPKRVLIFLPQIVDYLSMCLESGAGELGLNYTTNDFTAPASEYSRRGRVERSGQKTKGQEEGAAVDDPSDEWWPPWQRRVGSRHEAENMTLKDWADGDRKYGSGSMYGGGFTWGQRVDPPPNPRQSFQQLRDRILAKEYDLVIYSALFLVRHKRFHSSVTDNLPLLDEVRAAMPPGKIVFVDGDDSPLFDMHWGATLEELVRAGSHMFVRESHKL